MVIIIVDTTVTFVDVMMRTTNWVHLLTLCRHSQLRLVVPDVVLRETVRHWQGQAIEAVELANARLDGIPHNKVRLEGLGLDASQLPPPARVTTPPDHRMFESATRERLSLVGAVVLPVPSRVDIEAVLQRDIARKKPFDSKGRGFRDTLIWETIKDVAFESGDGDTIYFVTDNSGDFCGDDGKLAPELLAEVPDPAAAARLIQVKDLDTLIASAEVAPMVAGLTKSNDDVASLFTTFLARARAGRPSEPNEQGDDHEQQTVNEIVRAAVLTAAEELVGEDVEAAYEAPYGDSFLSLIPSEVEEPSISSIEPDESTIEWQTYDTYDDTTFLIRAEVVADIELVGFAYKADAIHSEESQILDWDWNDHMARVSVSVHARLIFRIRLEQGQGFVEECELEGVESSAPADDPHSVT